jgi:hypothetical protein
MTHATIWTLGEFALPPILLVLLLIALVAYLWSRRPTTATLANCSYIIFEAEPVNSAVIEAHLADNGWHLVSSSQGQFDTMLYKFEKSGSEARCLSEYTTLETQCLVPPIEP